MYETICMSPKKNKFYQRLHTSSNLFSDWHLDSRLTFCFKSYAFSHLLLSLPFPSLSFPDSNYYELFNKNDYWVEFSNVILITVLKFLILFLSSYKTFCIISSEFHFIGRSMEKNNLFLNKFKIFEVFPKSLIQKKKILQKWDDFNDPILWMINEKSEWVFKKGTGG